MVMRLAALRGSVIAAGLLDRLLPTLSVAVARSWYWPSVSARSSSCAVSCVPLSFSVVSSCRQLPPWGRSSMSPELIPEPWSLTVAVTSLGLLGALGLI